MPNDKYGLERILEESRFRAQQLESGLFGSVAWKPDSDRAMIFVVHKELGSGLHYGLVSNIGHNKLSALLGKEEVLSTFRDRWLVLNNEFIEGLIRRMREAEKEVLGCLVMVGISATQTVTTIGAFRDGKHEKVPTDLQDFLSTAHPSRGLKARLASFRGLVGNGDVGCYLLARSEPRISSGTNRRREPVDLFGLGVLALRGSVIEAPAEKERVAISAERWMDTSKLATLTLFCERERYYQKAVRQAAQGWMVKWGDKEAIEKQKEALAELNTYVPHAAPPVLLYGVGPGRTHDSKVGWYRMPRYVMPSLGELLVRVEGFTHYELATLARATFQHLRRFFWRDLTFESVTTADGGTAGAVAAALTTAHFARESARSVLKQFVALATQGHPVVAFGKLGVLPSTEKAQLQSFWPQLLEGTLPAGQLSLRVEAKLITLYSVGAGTGLDALGNKVTKKLVAHHPGEAWAPAVDVHGRIHGDAHFENFLVDASIPEDPFAVAIDIASVQEIGTDPSKAGDLMRAWGIALRTTRFDILNRIQSDPSYDIAKLLLSATCWFGAVQRGAFVIEGTDGSSWTLTADSAGGPQASGNETGGVSGAEVLRMVAPIGPDVWRNHLAAAEEILREYVEFLRKAAKDSSCSDSDIDCVVNVSLLRTFLFLIRNAFSIAPRLFLARPMNAAVMFAIGEHCAFEVDRLLLTATSLKSESLTDKLVARLGDITAVVPD